MPTITIANVKGGCGKSTLTLNIAVQLRQAGRGVLLIDADPSIRTLSTWEQDREDTGAPIIPVVHKTGMLHKTLSSLADQHDVIIVDVPGKDSPEMRTALTASDLALVPVLPSQPDVDATTGTLAQILEQAREYNDHLHTLAVLTRVPTHIWSKEVAEAAQILTDAGFTLAETRVHDRAVFRSSLSEGLSAPESSNAKAKAEIRTLTEQVLTLIEGAHQ